MEEIIKGMKIQSLTHRNSNKVLSEYIITIPSHPNVVMTYKCTTVFANEDEALSYGMKQAKKRVKHGMFEAEEKEIEKLEL